ncbi:MAG TPA: TonB-dependent receptor [Bryobacteraceae bacterium]|nr:TonB-dependent receptor [Bryobacteraceae bacterium]
MRKNFLTVFGFALAASLAITAPLMAQEFRATITGTVIDDSGAAIAGAQVEVRNAGTSFVTMAQTNEAGAYTVPFLLPGTYKVTITAKGFKQSVREGVELHAGDKLQVDAKLEVGGATETVTVSANSELLQTATATLGQVINSEQVKDLPLLGRNPFMLATLATGVNSGLYSQKVSQFGRPFDGAAAQMSMGGLGGQYQILLNGIPDAPPERASGAIYVGFVPSPEAVEEVNVQTNLYDAQYGHTSGAVINTVLKGGTNRLHGTAYEFFRNDVLNANTFESNYAHTPKAIMRWNQPGFELDGPVYIPKVYNGKNKTFFMVSWELIRNSNPTPFVGTVPTAEERNGDFSHLVQSNGQPILIYDPLTTQLVNGQYVRQTFPGNVIPPDRISPVGQALIGYYPGPNVAGNAAGFNNYVNSPNSQTDKYNSLSIRVDHQINDRNRLSGTVVNNVRHQNFGTAGFDPVASPGYLHFRNNHGGSLDWTDTISPTLVADVRYGVIYHPFQVAYFGDGFDLSKLGFPASFIAQLPHQTFPGVSLSNGYSGLQNAASQFSTTLTHSLAGTISKSLNRHTIKFGAEFFAMRANNDVPESNVGAFSFSSGFTQQNAQSGSASAGNPLASMLLGYPTGGSVNYNIASAYQQLYYGAFVQDDWRVNSRLTLNLGLRWDYEGPMSERYNRQNRGFDFTATNPLQAQVSGLTLQGGLLFTDSSQPLPFVRDSNNWQPRIGVAYRAFSRTVIRGGFGIMHPPTFNTGGSTGFSVSTGYVASTDGNLTPANSLSNPFPSGIIVPPGRSLGLSTQVGQNIGFADPSRTVPTVYQYSLGIEQQLPGQILAEIAFGGNYATGLPVSRNINALPFSDFSLGNTALLQQVPNPMAGLLPGSSLNNATIPLQNLLVPYPEFGSINESSRPLGSSLYNSMQVNVQKRLSAGLQFRASFTWSKIMQETSYLNNQDAWTDLARTQSNEPNKIFTFSTTYALPLFSRTKGLAKALLGGWSANAIFRVSAGYLVGAPGGAYSSGVDPKLSGSEQSYSQWFNTCSLNTSGVRQNCASASQPVAFIQLPPYTLASLGPVLTGIRTELPPICDFSLFKSFAIRESLNVQLRANAYNIGNTPQFNGPNTSFGSANFGVITLQQANDPRIVELALKVSF